MSSKFDILILSCDKYYSLIPGFIECYNRNIKSSGEVYFKTNTLNVENFNTIKIPNSTWSNELIEALKYLKNKHILLLLEDIYIYEKCNLDAVYSEVLNLDKEFSYVKIINIFRKNSRARIISKNEPYRINVIGFWNREVLLNLLLDFENPWEFEVNGSYRSRNYINVYELKKDIFKFKNMVEKGKYIRESYNWAITNNIEISRNFKIQNIFLSKYKKLIYIYYKYIIFNIPFAFRLYLSNLVKKILATY